MTRLEIPSSRAAQLVVTEFQLNLRQDPRTIPPCGTALALGRQAVTFGLEPLELAWIQALTL